MSALSLQGKHRKDQAIRPKNGIHHRHGGCGVANPGARLQSHGAASDDASELEVQTTQFEGACNPECADTHYAIHK